MYDCSDATNPRVGLPEAKQKDLLSRLKRLQVVKGSTLDHSEVESVAHKLSAACAATERGRMYLCGFYSALRNEKEGKIKMTGWLRRNVDWWVRYFESGAPRMKLLLTTTRQAAWKELSELRTSIYIEATTERKPCRRTGR